MFLLLDNCVSFGAMIWSIFGTFVFAVGIGSPQMDTLLLGKPRKWGDKNAEAGKWEIIISPFGRAQKLSLRLLADTNYCPTFWRTNMLEKLTNKHQSRCKLVLTAIDLKSSYFIERLKCCMNADWRSYQMEPTCVEYRDSTQIADESVTELQQISINTNQYRSKRRHLIDGRSCVKLYI